MSQFTQARRLLDALGPGRFLLIGPQLDLLAIEIRRLGCAVLTAEADPLPGSATGDADVPIDGVVWAWTEGWRVPPPAVQAALARRGARRFTLVRDPAQAAPEATAIRRDALAAGWRRSLADWSVQHYRELDHPSAWTELHFDLPPAGAPGRPGPLDAGDPTLDPSPQAEALLARYAQAAELVRPGDRVLVVDSGSGAGAALLAQRSRCLEVIGVDASPRAVAHARQQFGLDGLVRFEQSEGTRLAPIADRSIDIVVAIDAVDRAADAAALVAAFARVVRPDGRVVASAFDGPASCAKGDALEALLGGVFLLEDRYRQPDPVAGPTPARTIDRIAAGDAPPAGGWRLVVAAAQPIGADAAGFFLPEFASVEGPPVPVTDFGAHYANPWLYRPMVQMGQRLRDEALLTDLAIAVLDGSDRATADHGAALCVLAYQLLGRNRLDQVENLLPLIDAYAAVTSPNPHVLRWQISLDFAAALACLAAGEAATAEAYFERVTQRDPLPFSPLLSTKTIAASFWLGIRRLVERDPGAARRWFQAGVQAAARALQAPIAGAIGSLTRPNTFGFQELAEVADMASQCAQALDALDRFAAAPGRFWRQVDTRRFGLASWLLHLERENRDLHAQLQAARHQGSPS